MQVQPQRKSSKEPTTTEAANELTPEELGKVTAGTFDGFLSFGDIKGESTDKDHKDWIQVLSFRHQR
jgi:hypothetical protein